MAAGAEDRRRVGAGGDTHAGADVAEVPGVLEQHDRSALGRGENRCRVGVGAICERDHAGGGRQRGEAIEQLSVDLVGGAEIPGDVRREALREVFERGGVPGHELLQVRAETQGVLDGMEPFEHRQGRIPSRATEARD